MTYIAAGRVVSRARARAFGALRDRYREEYDALMETYVENVCAEMGYSGNPINVGAKGGRKHVEED